MPTGKDEEMLDNDIIDDALKDFEQKRYFTITLDMLAVKTGYSVNTLEKKIHKFNAKYSVKISSSPSKGN